MQQNKLLRIVLLLIALCAMLRPDAAHAATNTSLAAKGKALLPVVTSAGASAEVKKHAATLAQYLEKISGAKFETQTGDGSSGLAVGIATDFPALKLEAEFDLKDPKRREEYVLRSHGKGIYLIGATELAVSHAIWDLLYRFGYRHFFPGKNWEVVPNLSTLNSAVDVKEKPDFFSRRIWYGFGDWRENGPDKNAWDARNRMAMALHIRSVHSWQSIHKSYKAQFDAHPEYLMSAKPVKFCISNPGLRKLVVDHALRYFEANPDEDSISMEPSDGGGWENPEGACPDAEVYKSVSDRVVTLANEVAEAVNKKFPGKYVGIYAYYKHSPPPTIKVHPQVAVGVATSFISGGYTFEQLAKGWKDQGATIGVREYYSVVIGHQDRPGGPGAANFRGLPARVKNQYELGTRFMSAESSNSWGPAGLGYYLAARTMWDANADTQALIEDFFEKAFGPAQKPMREWYDLIDRGNKPLFSADLIGRMYRKIDEARKLTDDTGIRGRLDDLALYTRYVELLKNIKDEETTGATIGHAYRIRRTHMVHSYALWRESRNWQFKPAGNTRWDVPEGRNPWKNSTPFTAAEIDTIIREGIANNPLMDFKPISFSKELVPAHGLKLTGGKQGAYGHSRFAHHFYIWVDKAPATLEFTVTAGQIGGGKTELELFAVDDPTSEVLATATVPNDKQPHPVTLKTTFAGLHRVDVNPRRSGAHVNWAAGTPVVFPVAPEEAVGLSHRIHMYFYVPKGTKVVGGFASGVGSMLDGSGKGIFTFSKEQFDNGNYFSVPVPPGQDGKVWQFTNSAGARLLMTVPPYLARNANELLLPREVVEADAPK